MTSRRTIKRAVIYWDTKARDREGWAWRIEYDDGHEESGPWEDDKGDVAAMVVELCYRNGIEIRCDQVAGVDRPHSLTGWYDVEGAP